MRTVPPDLQAHLDTGATTMTFIMRIDPVTPGYPSVGCTMLDRDVVYDDGLGELTYAATTSLTPSTLATTSSMGVDNGQGQHLVPEGDMDISEDVLNAGVYDYANFRVYWVNYLDLSMGHIAITRGTLGQIRVEDGMTFWSELTSLGKQLKTPVVKKASRTCRAVFGSQPIGTDDGSYEERQPCGKDLSTLWAGPFTVSAPGAEATVTFTASGMSAAAGTYQPGMVEWLTGPNAGRQSEIEEQPGAGLVHLMVDTMFPIEAGDTFNIRPDCTKWWEGTNGCQFHFAGEWVLHYRGEPYLKPQESDSAITPGAAI